MADAVAVRAEVEQKIDALGADGRRWLDELPSIVEHLCHEWDLTAGETLPGGSAGLVLAVTMTDGREGVLKVAMPDGLEGNGEFGRELSAVRAGQGHGYVGLLDADPERRAVLLERLGRPLADLDLPADARLDRIATTVSRGWSAPLPDAIARTGADQAAFLASFIADRSQRFGEPCPEPVVDEARRCALARHDAFVGARAVLVHGDVHAANVLEDPHEPGCFKLIDPDAMRSEPAHDLGIAVRDESGALLGSDSAAGTLRSWCRRLAERSGVDVDPEAIWQWAFAERVSSGLFLLELGDPSGATFLRAAAALLDG